MAITWEEPITTWATVEDYDLDEWNRVVRDTGYLLDAIEYHLYDEQSFLQAWIVTASDAWELRAWQTIKSLLVIVNRTLGVNDFEIPADEMTAYEINKMELLLVLAKRALDQTGAVLYTGEPYTGQFEVYTG